MTKLTQCQEDLARVRAERDDLRTENTTLVAENDVLRQQLADCQGKASPVRSDDCTASVDSLWGRVDGISQAATDQGLPAMDRHLQLPGAGPNGQNCRELWTEPGDDYYQMRAEAGRNEWRYGMNGGAGTFMLYEAGMTTTTSLWIRLGDDYPLALNAWSSILQQKQTQPCGSTVPETGPAMVIHAYGGKFHLERFWKEVWWCPAEVGRWYRFDWTVNHRADASGWTQLTIKPEGSAVEFVSPRIVGATLMAEPSGTAPRLPYSAPVPSHLRMGPYHALNTQPRSVRYADIQVKAA